VLCFLVPFLVSLHFPSFFPYLCLPSHFPIFLPYLLHSSFTIALILIIIRIQGVSHFMRIYVNKRILLATSNRDARKICFCSSNKNTKPISK
jgi:hypothetical protein